MPFRYREAMVEPPEYEEEDSLGEYDDNDELNEIRDLEEEED